MDELLKKQIQELEKRVKKLEAGKPAPNADCLTKQQAMEWIGCSRSTLNNYIDSGQLPILWPNAARCLHPEDVITFMYGLQPKKRRKK